MAFKKISTRALMQAFDRIGFRFYETGSLSEKGTKTKLFDYYKGDKLTDEQKAELLKDFPELEFFGARPEYAPELRSAMVGVPKIARYRQRLAEVKAA
jgi:hypothetical protein